MVPIFLLTFFCLFCILKKKGGEKMTINEAYKKYHKFIELRQKPTTIKGTERKFKYYILPYFKDMEISEITPLVYLNWQEKINNINLSDSFKISIYYTMYSLYEYLDIFYNYNKNIPKMVGITKKNMKQKEISYWTIDEYNKFIKTFNDSTKLEYKYFFELLFYTGCRLGEANALTFNDIIDNNIFIYKSISKEKFGNNRLITSPKTNYSNRKIKIDDILLKEINELKDKYENKYENFNNDFYIFGGPKPLSPTTISRIKNEHCMLANVKQIRLHDFRHSHATLLLRYHVPIQEISSRLGHSDINITIKTYTHLAPEYEKNVMNKLNSLHSK